MRGFLILLLLARYWSTSVWAEPIIAGPYKVEGRRPPKLERAWSQVRSLADGQSRSELSGADMSGQEEQR